MKTIRQRKDELIASIRAKISEKRNELATASVPSANNSALFDEYKKILWSNGIKNETLIHTQLNKMIKAGLGRVNVYSNLKFMHLLRSRLTEEGIPLVDAEIILTHVNFNMAEINEDDDYIGDVALEFAELCKLHYDSLDNPKQIGDTFDVLNLQLPPA